MGSGHTAGPVYSLVEVSERLVGSPPSKLAEPIRSGPSLVGDQGRRTAAVHRGPDQLRTDGSRSGSPCLNQGLGPTGIIDRLDRASRGLGGGFPDAC